MVRMWWCINFFPLVLVLESQGWARLPLATPEGGFRPRFFNDATYLERQWHKPLGLWLISKNTFTNRLRATIDHTHFSHRQKEHMIRISDHLLRNSGHKGRLVKGGFGAATAVVAKCENPAMNLTLWGQDNYAINKTIVKQSPTGKPIWEKMVHQSYRYLDQGVFRGYTLAHISTNIRTGYEKKFSRLDTYHLMDAEGRLVRSNVNPNDFIPSPSKPIR